jgi:hypothetical protein
MHQNTQIELVRKSVGKRVHACLACYVRKLSWRVNIIGFIEYKKDLKFCAFCCSLNENNHKFKCFSVSTIGKYGNNVNKM